MVVVVNLSFMGVVVIGFYGSSVLVPFDFHGGDTYSHRFCLFVQAF